MGYIRRGLVFSMLAMLGVLLLLSPVAAQPKGGALMPQDVFTPLTKGYDLLKEGKYDAAKYEFETALKRDRYNPFALNNLAAVSSHMGKLKDAMAYLTDAGTYADQYLDKVDQTCFVDGLCNAVRPTRGTWGMQAPAGTKSTIGPIIQENMAKLKAKIAATPEKPQPSTPPPMEEKKK